MTQQHIGCEGQLVDTTLTSHSSPHAFPRPADPMWITDHRSPITPAPTPDLYVPLRSRRA
ncbi:hypothetical protein ABZT34_07155 [Streptomyces sp. NPDC005329]|uniref:hypothetical protein n=1 Tax=Streptomyces sp. NPDC005329 TaxID=3157034 RepID=UPI0033AB439C